jgi:hypothetical protein
MRTSLICRALLAGAAALGLGLAAPLAAQADDAFRFWSYYQWDADNWTFAQAGPADTRPADGDVEGWRFAVAGMDDPRFPRAAGDFDLICGSSEAGDGEKRVAVVIDFGTAADAEDGAEPPAARGACAVVAENASGADVLTAAADEVRYGDGGFTCGIAGYPATGCGGPAEGEAPSGPEDPVELALADTAGGGSDGGVPVGVLVGAGAVVLIGGGAVVAARRARAAA